MPPHPSPTPGLEQYATPAPIAADLLYLALAQGDVRERRVVDLGCGTGILSIGAALLGASHVTGIDVDADAVAAARENAAALHVDVEYLVADVEAVDPEADTVVMNPPFGAQFAARGADVRFLQTAVRCAPVVYSLHAARTRDHLLRRLDAMGARGTVIAEYAFPLPAQFTFHRKEKVVFDVVLLRTVRMG